MARGLEAQLRATTSDVAPCASRWSVSGLPPLTSWRSASSRRTTMTRWARRLIVMSSRTCVRREPEATVVVFRRGESRSCLLRETGLLASSAVARARGNVSATACARRCVRRRCRASQRERDVWRRRCGAFEMLRSLRVRRFVSTPCDRGRGVSCRRRRARCAGSSRGGRARLPAAGCECVAVAWRRPRIRSGRHGSGAQGGS